VTHVGCCVLLLSTALSYCRQDYVCRGFWQVVRTYVLLWYKKKKGVNVGHPRHKNVVWGSILCRLDWAVLAKSADIWLSGRHVADMSATLPLPAKLVLRVLLLVLLLVLVLILTPTPPQPPPLPTLCGLLLCVIRPYDYQQGE
jgi:hypothetical protein